MATKSSNVTQKLPLSAYQWALKHLKAEGDTDLLPPLMEIDAFKFNWQSIKSDLINLDLNNYEWKGGRRFIVPKNQLSFRIANQLDPLDSLILAAIIRKYGGLIEKSRIPKSDKRVFSYRFEPTKEGWFYGDLNNWHDFWSVSRTKALDFSVEWVVVTDITDYYNQVYHHVLENQLSEAKVPTKIIKSLIGLITQLTQSVSRGIPVGPHAIHLLAECALNPSDRSFLSHGLNYCRYVDDIHVFCNTKQEAEVAVHDLADILDKQQRLTLNALKTRIVPAGEFVKLADSMLIDRPLNRQENEVLRVIKKYSSNNPYAKFSLQSLDPADMHDVNSEKLESLFSIYLAQDPVDYTRIRWLLRRLSQFGAPGAVDFVLSNIDKFIPALEDVARYIMASSNNYQGDFDKAGSVAIRAMENPIIEHSDYLQVVLLNLFTQVPRLDHIDDLTIRYNESSPNIRREIVLAAASAGLGHWIKERKNEFDTADPWLRRALLYASTTLPGDEAEIWINKIKRHMNSMEKIVTKWAFQSKTLKLGDMKIS